MAFVDFIPALSGGSAGAHQGSRQANKLEGWRAGGLGGGRISEVFLFERDANKSLS